MKKFVSSETEYLPDLWQERTKVQEYRHTAFRKIDRISHSEHVCRVLLWYDFDEVDMKAHGYGPWRSSKLRQVAVGSRFEDEIQMLCERGFEAWRGVCDAM